MDGTHAHEDTYSKSNCDILTAAILPIAFKVADCARVGDTGSMLPSLAWSHLAVNKDIVQVVQRGGEKVTEQDNCCSVWVSLLACVTYETFEVYLLCRFRRRFVRFQRRFWASGASGSARGDACNGR